MSKFFLFFPLFLYSLTFPYTVELKKDETISFEVTYLKNIYLFNLRWTLFKNDVLTVLYRYDNFPRQITLYKDYPLNAFKVPVAKIPDNYPYFYIVFKDFNGKIATFDIYLKNGKKVVVKVKE